MYLAYPFNARVLLLSVGRGSSCAGTRSMTRASPHSDPGRTWQSVAFASLGFGTTASADYSKRSSSAKLHTYMRVPAFQEVLDVHRITSNWRRHSWSSDPESQTLRFRARDVPPSCYPRSNLASGIILIGGRFWTDAPYRGQHSISPSGLWRNCLEKHMARHSVPISTIPSGCHHSPLSAS